MANHFNIPFQETGYFSKITCDYLNKNKNLSKFYNNYPDLNGFKNQIKEKKKSFSDSSRKVLVKSLKDQYKNFEISNLTKKNIQLLEDKNTFTIITGHQLNLFTGPLYFLYKIISTINLTELLKKEFPEYNFVPIYWMATEDHDFEEIKFYNFKDKKISWDRKSAGAVGRLSTQSLDKVFYEFSNQLGGSKNAQNIKDLFKASYLDHNNLTDATKYLANKLFGEYGLVILDGDDKNLKSQFIPFVKEELINQTCFNEVTKTNSRINENYKIQVNPREINLFYLDENLRERVVFEDGIYQVLNSNLKFTREEILKEVEDHPEKFSPNVLMRPLYEEVVSPNLCYIGGGGELAYWFELKSYFESQNITFPILLLRNSVLLITEKQKQKMEKLNITNKELFFKQNDLIREKVRSLSEINLDLSNEKEKLKKMFAELEELSNKTDKSFTGAVKAQSKKQQNGLLNLEKRLLIAQKRKHKDLVERIISLQNGLFPHFSLQERNANFSEFYEMVGDDLIKKLKENLDPLKLEFDILTM